MTSDPQSAFIVAVIGLAVGVVGVALAAFAVVRMSRLYHSYELLQVAEGRETIVDVMGRTMDEFSDLRDDVARLESALATTRRDLAMALRHVSVVRYDAFGDMGGRFSFSAALLDDAGDGLVITSIHARSETRTYLKGLHAGDSDITLSPEEQQAVRLARGADS
ncbi:MAG: DUF4446 family protein [Actinomycetota bacterium]|nr:DUF4446 family protein [Actinomycetota bacterium]